MGLDKTSLAFSVTQCIASWNMIIDFLIILLQHTDVGEKEGVGGENVPVSTGQEDERELQGGRTSGLLHNEILILNQFRDYLCVLFFFFCFILLTILSALKDK